MSLVTLLKRLSLFSLIVFTSQVQANESFEIFKLTPKFNQKYNQNEAFTKTTSEQEEKEWNLDDLKKYIQENMHLIGNRITSKILKFNDDYPFGESNYSGFEWDTIVGDFGLKVMRKVSPHLRDRSRWIVKDEVEILIGAKTYLEKLIARGEVDMDEGKLSLFAGIYFKRKYTLIHYADSYMEGLKSDFEKLFLGFTYLKDRKFLVMNEGEYIVKEDWLSIKGGANASTPPVYFVSLEGGLHVIYSRISQLLLKAMPSDSDEWMRLSFKKGSMKSYGASLRAQADFYKLLKITLLRADYQYGFAEDFTTYMSFNQIDREKMLDPNHELSLEIDKMVKQKKIENWDLLEPHIIADVDSDLDFKNFRLSALLWGSKKTSTSEEIIFNQRDQEPQFLYRDTYRKTVQRKKLFGGILIPNRLFPDIEAEWNKETFLEYVLPMEQREWDSKKRVLDLPGDFSISFHHNFVAVDTTGWAKKDFKEAASHFVDHFTPLDEEISQKIADEELHGPVEVQHNAILTKEGFEEFASRDQDEVSETLAFICFKDRTLHDQKESWAEKKCRRNLEKKYDAFMDMYFENRQVSVTKFREFTSLLVETVQFMDDYSLLFNTEHLYTYGSFRAQIKDSNHKYVTYFGDESIPSFGVILDYLDGTKELN